MAEIRLICPGCAAEYGLPRDAIPAEGREVECSDCGRVWQARRPPSGTAPLALGAYARPVLRDDPDDTPAVRPLPPASRRLSPDVLDILRQEVEHERRLRAADSPAAPAAPLDPPEPDTDWPATTVTLPAGATRAFTANPQPQVPLPEAVAHPPPTAARRPPPGPIPEQPRPVAHPIQHERTRQEQTHQDHTRPPARSGYGAGFVLSLTIAACALGLYVLTPVLAEQDSALGDQLLEWRNGVDRARLWLSDQAGRLRG